MPTVFACTNSHCGKPLRPSKSQVAGAALRCPYCGQVFCITSSADTLAAASQASEPNAEDTPGLDLSDSEPRTDTSATRSFAGRSSRTGENVPSLPADHIGRFAIRRKLGEGAFGNVYEAYDAQLDRAVALKVAKLERGDAAQRIQRFLREAKVAANLRHPHIVPLYEYGQDRDQFFIASAFIQGVTLQDDLETRKGLKPDLIRSARIIQRMAEAVAYAHAEGIVHRDLKPANTMLDTNGQPLVMDFGLATRQDEAGKLTHAGQVLGTPRYMSPEQAKGESASAMPASDQYSLGVMLYEMITGKTPFSGTVELVMYHHAETEPPSPRKSNRAISRDLETICLKCLEKAPARRFESCQALAEDLRRFLDGEPIRVRRARPLERILRWSRRKPTAAAAICLAIAVIVLLVFGLSLNSLRRNAEHMRAEAEKARDGEKIARYEVEKSQKRMAMVEYGRTIALAYQEWRDGNIGEAARLLRRTQPALRGWEWHYVDRLCNSSVLEIPHTAQIRSINVGDTGEIVTMLNSDRSPPIARKFEMTTGTQVGVSQVPEIVATDRQLRWVVTKNGEIREAADGKLRTTLRGWPKSFSRLIVSSNGERIAASTFFGPTNVWDSRTGDMIASLNLAHFAMDATGTNLVGFSSKQSLSVWSVETGKIQQKLGGQIKGITAIAVSPDGSKVAVAGASQRIGIFDSGSGHLLTLFQGHSDVVNTLAFSPDGRRLLSGSKDNTARLWNIQTGEMLQVIRAHGGGVSSVMFNPAGTKLLTAGNDHFVRVWEAERDPEAIVFKAYKTGGLTHEASISPDGASIAVAGGGSPPTQVFDAEKGMIRFVLKSDSGAGATSAEYSADGTRILTTAFDNKARVWDARTGAPLTVFTGHTKPVTCAAFERDGDRAASAGYDCSVRIWNSRTAQEIHCLNGHTHNVWSVTFSPDGRMIASGASDGSVLIWDAVQGSERKRFDLSKEKLELDPKHPGIPRTGVSACAAFSPEGDRLAILSGSLLRVYDTASWSVVLSIETPPGEKSGIGGVSMAYSPDGRRIVSCGKGIRIWDAEFGAELLALKTHGSAHTASFSSDGMRISSGCFSGFVYVWDARPLRHRRE